MFRKRYLTLEESEKDVWLAYEEIKKSLTVGPLWRNTPLTTVEEEERARINAAFLEAEKQFDALSLGSSPLSNGKLSSELGNFKISLSDLNKHLLEKKEEIRKRIHKFLAGYKFQKNDLKTIMNAQQELKEGEYTKDFFSLISTVISQYEEADVKQQEWKGLMEEFMSVLTALNTLEKAKEQKGEVGIGPTELSKQLSVATNEMPARYNDPKDIRRPDEKSAKTGEELAKKFTPIHFNPPDLGILIDSLGDRDAFVFFEAMLRGSTIPVVVTEEFR